MNFLQTLSSFIWSSGKASVARTPWTVSGSKEEGIDLCGDMVYEIFSHLVRIDLDRSMIVCKRWYEVGQKNNLWEKFFLERKEIHPTTKIPQNYFYLYESFHANALTFQIDEKQAKLYYDYDKEGLKEFFSRYDDIFLRHLHSLHLSSFNGLSNRACAWGIQYLIGRCPSLELLDFTGLEIDERVIVVAVGYFKSINRNKAVIQLEWNQRSQNIITALGKDKLKGIHVNASNKYYIDS